MNLEQALYDLNHALDELTEPNAEKRIRSARQVLVVRGAEALGIEQPIGLSLHDVIRTGVNTSSASARRTFGVLLVHALGFEGLVAARSHRGQFDRDLCVFMEHALPTVLQRSGYPFGGEIYQRRRSLERLHTTIHDLLKPLEPTFPPTVQGLYAG